MLDGLRKRFGSLIAGNKVSVVEQELAVAPQELSPKEEQKQGAVEALLLARREAQKREARLILTERIHNRAAMLLNGIRTDLLQRIHGRIEEENQSESLHSLLEVALDPAFTTRVISHAVPRSTILDRRIMPGVKCLRRWRRVG